MARKTSLGLVAWDGCLLDLVSPASIAWHSVEDCQRSIFTRFCQMPKAAKRSIIHQSNSACLPGRRTRRSRPSCRHCQRVLGIRARTDCGRPRKEKTIAVPANGQRSWLSSLRYHSVPAGTVTLLQFENRAAAAANSAAAAARRGAVGRAVQAANQASGGVCAVGAV